RKKTARPCGLLLHFLYFLCFLYFLSFHVLNFSNCFATALADRGIASVLSHVSGEVPAALALLAVSALHRHLEARHGLRTKITSSRVDEIHLRNNEKGGQHRQIVFELGLKLKVGIEKNFCLKPGVDELLFVTRGFQSLQDL